RELPSSVDNSVSGADRSNFSTGKQLKTGRGDMAQILHRSTSDFATAAIRQMILTGDLKPGDRVDQNEIATRLNISRHPVRQAIERLAERGFVQSRPHRSVIVSELSAADMEQLYFARGILEKEAIRLSWAH